MSDINYNEEKINQILANYDVEGDGSKRKPYTYHERPWQRIERPWKRITRPWEPVERPWQYYKVPWTSTRYMCPHMMNKTFDPNRVTEENSKKDWENSIVQEILKEILESNNPKTIGRKCYEECLKRMLKPFAATGIANIIDNWETLTTVLDIVDEMDEMKVLDYQIDNALVNYVIRSNREGEFNLYHLDLIPYCNITEKGGITFPATKVEDWTSSTSWWLNGACFVYADGKIYSKRNKNGYVKIVSAKLKLKWKDTIDPNPSFKTDEAKKAIREYIAAIYNFFIKFQFPIEIEWEYIK